mmetsp:Transcript_58753/g.157067  ORF Transcript_58753/g.157067 Transcript_58753/m.157067 type:complete len:162 (+) Transcript_58753:2-487(+)
MFRSAPRLFWHYKYWQRQTAGWLMIFHKNNALPNNEMLGYVVSDKHPKTIKVKCDRYLYVMRYKKSFRKTKPIWAHDEHEEARLGDIVRVQPLGYRLGPWKTYVLAEVLHREPRVEDELRGSDARNLLTYRAIREEEKENKPAPPTVPVTPSPATQAKSVE